MRSGLFLPLFDAMADPLVVARLAAEAEAAGWDGVFVWDHVVWRAPIEDVADPWITLAAIAAATERIRIGPMVTPLPRRRPAKVARETATLDRLSGGRLTLGVGLGGNEEGGEFPRTGEETDVRRRARMLDEALDVLTRAWTGALVTVQGEFTTLDDVRFLPRPVQRPRIPIWVAARPGRSKPLARAARYDGLFPVELAGPDQLAEMGAVVTELRDGRSFDLIAPLPVGADPRPYAGAGATWWVVDFPPEGTTADLVRGVIADGPRG